MSDATTTHACPKQSVPAAAMTSCRETPDGECNWRECPAEDTGPCPLKAGQGVKPDAVIGLVSTCCWRDADDPRPHGFGLCWGPRWIGRLRRG